MRGSVLVSHAIAVVATIGSLLCGVTWAATTQQSAFIHDLEAMAMQGAVGSPLAAIAQQVGNLDVPLVRIGGGGGGGGGVRLRGRGGSVGDGVTTALPAGMGRGMTLFSLSETVLAEPATLGELQDMKNAGIHLVSVVIALNMDNATANVVTTSDSTTTDEALVTFLKTADALGLRTLVKPLIIPRGSSMYLIKPTDAAQWFASVRNWTLHYANIAAATNAHAMSLGVEYLQMTGPQYAGEWQDLANAVRAVFGGKLTYCSLFVKEWHNIEWWHALDWVGIDAYFPMGSASNPTPSVSHMVDTYNVWLGFVRTWRGMSGYSHMPIVITEVGFGSYASVAATPSTSPPNCSGVYKPDLPAQQRCYQALFQAVSANADLIDTLIMFWYDNPSTPDYYVNATSHGDKWACWFTPRGKPAYQTLTAAFAQP